MNVWDVILTLLLIAAVGGALAFRLRRKKRGGCSCGCADCGMDCGRRTAGSDTSKHG